MGKATAERKKARREALRPKPEQTITKLFWLGLSKNQKKRHKDGSRFVRMNNPGGTLISWVCVRWFH